MGLASKLVLAYGVQQGAQVIQQLNKPSPYPQAQGPGQAQSYYQQSPASHQQPVGQHGGYNPGYAAAGGAAVGAAVAGAYAHGHGQGAPPSYGAGAAGNATNVQYIVNILQQCVMDQNLQAFYPPGSLEPVAHRIAQTGALNRISTEWRIPMEVAVDMAKLALFDTVLYLDDSGSMQFEENGSRIDDLKLIVSRVAQAASLFDSDGITVRMMNSRVEGNNITNDQLVQQFLSTINFSGLTPFGTNLDHKVIQPLVVGPARANVLRKPILVIAVTDGEPTGEDRRTLVNAVRNAKAALQQTRYGADALSVEIAQVGNDQKARAFLEQIDSDPHAGGMIDVTGTYEQESDNMQRVTGISLTPDMWLQKLMLGGISSDYDHKDESRY
ncbi:hypothetical protein JCM10207_005787 [Rhodosporidiobolus poonsookiae]